MIEVWQWSIMEHRSEQCKNNNVIVQSFWFDVWASRPRDDKFNCVTTKLSVTQVPYTTQGSEPVDSSPIDISELRARRHVTYTS